ncbi:MAG: 4-hydroxybenzoate octaprenyltransferase, partial [Pseudohongiellaceae bacterium]
MNLNLPQMDRIKREFQHRFPDFYAKLPGFYLLARMDKPIGIYLLLWPTIAALWIAAEGFPDLELLVIFLLGTFVMRAAGCAVNDLADRDFDGRVARTRQRPLASGLLTTRDAVYFFITMSLFGFVLVLFTNSQTILLACAGIVVVVLYPFMKRYTHLPQLVLGVAFSWGILMAFTAQRGEIPATAWLLFIANALWIVAYDTEYAMVDREDDIEVGIKSTAILFGSADRMMIG